MDDWPQIKARHYEVEGDDSDGSFAPPSVCATCLKPWPCDFRAALQRVEELEADVEAACENGAAAKAEWKAAEAKLARVVAVADMLAECVTSEECYVSRGATEPERIALAALAAARQDHE